MFHSYVVTFTRPDMFYCSVKMCLVAAHVMMSIMNQTLRPHGSQFPK